MSLKCEEPIDEPTVQVWLLYHHPNFKYCTLYAEWNCGQTRRQTTDDLITRCPRRTFQAGDIKKSKPYYSIGVEHAWKIWSLYHVYFIWFNTYIQKIQVFYRQTHNHHMTDAEEFHSGSKKVTYHVIIQFFVKLVLNVRRNCHLFLLFQCLID